MWRPRKHLKHMQKQIYDSKQNKSPKDQNFTPKLRSKSNFEPQILSCLIKPKGKITQCTSRMGDKNRSRMPDQPSKTNPEKLNNSELHEVQNHKLEPKSEAKQLQ